MLLRVLSDLHTEFWKGANFHRTLKRAVPPLETDKETVLLLAGDLGTFCLYNNTLRTVFRSLAKRFRYVLAVSGNHEWYNSCVWGFEKAFWADKKLPENLFILEDGYKIIDDVVFIGSTLWTDFDCADKLAMDWAERSMNDFRIIRVGRDLPNADSYLLRTLPPLRPIQTVERHEKSRQFIFDALKLFRDKKRVVLTHHAPSSQSVHPRFQKSLLNRAFYSDLDKELKHIGPDLWVHGHMHDNFDYRRGKTRVICNPYAYVFNGRRENKGYIPALTLEV